MSVLAILCVRDTSTRLPLKWAAEIAGAPLLAHVASRLRLARSVRKIVVAIPEEGSEKAKRWAAREGLDVVFGPEHDVVNRMQRAVDLHGRSDDLVFRAMSDQPFLDWDSLDAAASLMEGRKWDFVLPLTFGADPVYGAALSPWSMRAWHWVNAQSRGEEREHVGIVLRKDLKRWSYGVRDVPHWAFRSYRLEVDAAADVRLCAAIWSVWNKPEEPPLREVVKLLDRNPELVLLNADVAEKTNPVSVLSAAEVKQWREDLRGRPIVYSEVGVEVGRIARPATCPKCGGAMVVTRLGAQRVEMECASCASIRTYRA